MKNKRKTRLALTAASLCLLAAFPVRAQALSQNAFAPLWQESENVSYIVDFLDYDGSILDSRVCEYGEKLEDIKIPQRLSDEEYNYQFAGWEPQLSEIVTDCACYMAVYQRQAKSSVSGGNNSMEPEIHEQSEVSQKASSNTSSSEAIDQIHAVSFDVISFQIGTETEKPKPPIENTENLHEPTIPEDSSLETISSESAHETNKNVSQEENGNSHPASSLAAGTDHMPNTPETSAGIDTDSFAAQMEQPDDAAVRKKKQEPARPIHKKNNRVEKAPEKASIQKTAQASVSDTSTPTPAPALKKSGQISRTQLPASPLTWIFTGCMLGMLHFGFRKYRRRS